MRSTFKVLFYLKRNKDKKQSAVPVMGRITVNGSIVQFSAKLCVPESLWEVSGGRAKGRSVEADRINRHLDNIRIQIPNISNREAIQMEKSLSSGVAWLINIVSLIIYLSGDG